MVGAAIRHGDDHRSSRIGRRVVVVVVMVVVVVGLARRIALGWGLVVLRRPVLLRGGSSSSAARIESAPVHQADILFGDVAVDDVQC